MAQYKNITADTQVKIGAGKLKGLFFSVAASTPTFALYDSPDGDTNDPKILGEFTPTAGREHFFGDDGIFFSNGLYADIGNSVSVTVIYE